MSLPESLITLLGLHTKERTVLRALSRGHYTPYAIAHHTHLSRTTVYDILSRLHKRGLVRKVITHGKRIWKYTEPETLAQLLLTARNEVLHPHKHVDAITVSKRESITVYRGANTIRELTHNMFKSPTQQRFRSLQGDRQRIHWEQVFSSDDTNTINKYIKNNAIVVDSIVPKKWYERHAESLGVQWIQNFIDRTTEAHEVDSSYFTHGAQLWIFHDCVYLVSLREEVVIAIQNSEIQKMILSMFEHMKDHAEHIDANAVLREYLHSRRN